MSIKLAVSASPAAAAPKAAPEATATPATNPAATTAVNPTATVAPAVPDKPAAVKPAPSEPASAKTTTTKTPATKTTTTKTGKEAATEKPAAARKAATPEVRLIEIAPAAMAARPQRRHRLVVLSFIALVLAPLLAAGIYLYTAAADQYASTLGFTVRTEETSSAMEILGGLSKLSSASSSDTDILYKFVQSQELVREVDARLDLRTMWNKPDSDPVFTLGAAASIEDLARYWKRMVRTYYDPGTGLIEIEARAFTPEDARTIARELFTQSDRMINTLSAIARADATRYAREELDTAVERLKAARTALTQFRNETQIVDPAADLQGQMGLLTSLNGQLATALIDLDLLHDTVRTDDPRLEQTRRKIAVIEKRIAEERDKLGAGSRLGGRAYADLVGEFERLRVDLEFAEKAYVSAQSAHDTAVAEARRQSRYLAAYAQPALAEDALYPQRLIILLISGFVLFALWAIGVLTYYSLRDRR